MHTHTRSDNFSWQCSHSLNRTGGFKTRVPAAINLTALLWRVWCFSKIVDLSFRLVKGPQEVFRPASHWLHKALLMCTVEAIVIEMAVSSFRLTKRSGDANILSIYTPLAFQNN